MGSQQSSIKYRRPSFFKNQDGSACSSRKTSEDNVIGRGCSSSSQQSHSGKQILHLDPSLVKMSKPVAETKQFVDPRSPGQQRTPLAERRNIRNRMQALQVEDDRLKSRISSSDLTDFRSPTCPRTPPSWEEPSDARVQAVRPVSLYPR
mmetsp:Transcript_4098/g.6483  ORF Transcript_4098/g.6483 Transcript_4098/m.6483 type:complete len:149 (+) Transcript_4098:478-924(+)